MEAALDRIELKLDLKADSTRVAALEAKHNALERQFSDMASGKTTTPLGTMYLERFSNMEKSVERLEDNESNRAAVLLAAKDKADAQATRLAMFVGLAVFGNVVFTIVMRLFE